MNIKNSLFGYVFAAGLLVAPLAHAHETGDAVSGHGVKPMHKWHEMKEKRTQKIYAQLNLTDEQKKQLEDNKQKNREQKKALFKQMKSSKETLVQEFMKPDLDMNKINAIHAQIKALQAQMADNRMGSILAVRKILTPEQFKKFHELTEKHGKMGRHHEDEEKEGDK